MIGMKLKVRAVAIDENGNEQEVDLFLEVHVLSHSRGKVTAEITADHYFPGMVEFVPVPPFNPWT